ncbi:hypothetical protein TNCV_360581 [Trichonephila clavipes]|nr:hypothetical protein TNCV_360581 [Trichonephila clavipes]
MPSGPGDFERFKSPMASSNVCIEKATPNKDHSPSCSGDHLWIPNYATACAVEDPLRKAKASNLNDNLGETKFNFWWAAKKISLLTENQIEAHEIHRGKGLDVRMSLDLALSTIQVTVRISSGTIDGDTTDLHLHNLGMELKRREIFSSPPALVHSAQKTFGPTDLTSTYSVCTWMVFGDIGHRNQAFSSRFRCSNH